jgi:hypothetical protein
MCINFVGNLFSAALVPVSNWCLRTGINGVADHCLNHTATNDCFIPNRSEEIVFNRVFFRASDILLMEIVRQVYIVQYFDV